MNIVSTRNGWLWVLQGFSIFRKSPAIWILLVLSYWSMMALLSRLPILGTVLATLSLPVFAASFAIMAHEVAIGGRLMPALLFSGFQRSLRTLLILGAMNMAAMAAAFACTFPIDGGILMGLAILGKPLPATVLPGGADSGAFMFASVVAGLLAAPVQSAFWFAPMLVAGVAGQKPLGAVQSLFYSFFACWRNWRAFIVYGATLSTVFVFIALALQLVVRSDKTLPVAMLAMVLVLLPTLFGTFYASYRDIFSPQSESAPGPGTTDDTSPTSNDTPSS